MNTNPRCVQYLMIIQTKELKTKILFIYRDSLLKILSKQFNILAPIIFFILLF